MPPFKTHEECRIWICFPCGKKADRPGLTEGQLAHIRRIYPQFDSQREHLPGIVDRQLSLKISDEWKSQHSFLSPHQGDVAVCVH